MASNWYKSFMAERGVDVGSHKPEKAQPDPAMDFENMRDNGVRSLKVTCVKCYKVSVVNMDGFDERLTMKSFEPKMVCRSCGHRGADVRPNWAEKPSRLFQF